MLREFSLELEKIDSLFSIVDIKRIMEIQEEIVLQKGQTSLETRPYCADYYDFEMIKNEKSINSVFIVATPSPFYVLRTKYNEKNIDLKIPPIYGNRSDILENIKSVTAKIFTKYELSTFPVILPKKLLAAYSGLAQYGNNGLAYVKGMGSYHRLTTFATDFRNNNYTWIKPSLMNSCAHCGKCVENCPSKALKQGTPWVNVNKCITEFNEQEDDFPDWLHRDWHNCVIGCIKCQEVCPLNNKEWRTIIIPIEYSEVEELLHSKNFSDVSEHLKTILKSLDLDRYYTEIKRNINYLIRS